MVGPIDASYSYASPCTSRNSFHRRASTPITLALFAGVPFSLASRSASAASARSCSGDGPKTATAASAALSSARSAASVASTASSSICL